MRPCCFIFGFGYTAKALTLKLLENGFKVIGTTRRPEEQNNLDIKLIDFDSTEIARYLNLATHILVSIPPIPTATDIVSIKYRDLIKKQTPQLQWLGYLSSTGVYGDHQGQWVDETSQCIPHTPTGIARLKAENAWISLANEYQVPLHVFRLSGIYGPGRNALTRLMQGKKQSIFKEGHFFCRIHVDDICATLMASINKPNPLSIYNVSDNEPAPAHLVDLYAATILQREAPALVPYSESALSAMEQEFYSNNRKVSNLKIKKELDIILQYPTYKEGLTAIWKEYFATKPC